MFGGTIQYFENEGKPFRGFMSLQGTFISLDQTVATRALCLEVTDGLTESLVLCAPPCARRALPGPRAPLTRAAAKPRRERTWMSGSTPSATTSRPRASPPSPPTTSPCTVRAAASLPARGRCAPHPRRRTLPADDIREEQNASAGAAAPAEEGPDQAELERQEQERRLERLRRASVAMEQRAMHESLRRHVEGRNMSAQIDFLEHVVEQMARYYLVSGVKIRKVRVPVAPFAAGLRGPPRGPWRP